MERLYWSPADTSLTTSLNPAKLYRNIIIWDLASYFLSAIRPKLFWDNFFPQAVGHEFTLISLGACFVQHELAFIAHIPGKRRCRWLTLSITTP